MTGQPLTTFKSSVLSDLLALVDLQVQPNFDQGGWDVSWWTGTVLFEGWENWWATTRLTTPETARRLFDFLEPAWGYRLPSGDLVHGDLNLTNVLSSNLTVTGIVDWDNVGFGSRSSDLAAPLFDWYRLRLSNQSLVVSNGGDRLMRRIIEIADVNGLRCAIVYGAIARIALSARRDEQEMVTIWCRVADVIMDTATCF